MNSTPTTLFAGRDVAVTLADGSPATFRVHQLKLSQYEAAFALLADEIALTALICGHDKAWADNLSQPGYEALFTAAQEANPSFFAWSARRRQREEELQRAQIAAFSQLPPEVARAAAEAGLKAQGQPSPSGSRLGRRGAD